MRLSTIARGNVRRHLSRTLLLVAVIAVTVGAVTALYLVTRSAERDLADQVDEYGANIVVVPRTDDLPRSYGGVDLGGLTYDAEPLHMSEIDVIRGIDSAENINLVAPKLLESAEVRGRRALIAGVVWDQELSLKKWWSIEGAAPSGERRVLAGSRVADLLELRPGAVVEIEGERFWVDGVLAETGGGEDDLLFTDIATVQRLWDRPEEVSFFEVAAWCSTCPIETINAEIAAEMPYARVSAVLKAAESRELLIGQFRLFGMVLSALMIGVGGLIVLSTTLGAVRDRQSEIGIFRAVGYRRRHIFSVILLENIGLALLGGAIGIGLAVGAHGPLARWVAAVRDPLAPGVFDLAVVLVAAAGAVVLATLYPAWRASRLSPTLAMRDV